MAKVEGHNGRGAQSLTDLYTDIEASTRTQHLNLSRTFVTTFRRASVLRNLRDQV